MEGTGGGGGGRGGENEKERILGVELRKVSPTVPPRSRSCQNVIPEMGLAPWAGLMPNSPFS